MKTIYLKQLKSGNYRKSHKSDYSNKFKSKKEFVEWYLLNINGCTYRLRSHGSRVIKATYSQSQTYFPTSNRGAEECFYFLKK